MSTNGTSTLRYGQVPFGGHTGTRVSLSRRFASLAAMVTGMATEFRARKQMRRLLSKDDWLLDDIGLTRKALVVALDAPLHVRACDELRKRHERFGQQ
ncbi:MAG: hypothetical protein AAGD23_09685 [Pseudomonadota bacterium]